MEEIEAEAVTEDGEVVVTEAEVVSIEVEEVTGAEVAIEVAAAEGLTEVAAEVVGEDLHLGKQEGENQNILWPSHRNG